MDHPPHVEKNMVEVEQSSTVPNSQYEVPANPQNDQKYQSYIHQSKDN